VLLNDILYDTPLRFSKKRQAAIWLIDTMEGAVLDLKFMVIYPTWF
jgi:hypothetical protein